MGCVHGIVQVYVRASLILGHTGISASFYRAAVFMRPWENLESKGFLVML